MNVRVYLVICSVILNCFLINQVNCYNILGVFPFMGKSHFYVYDVYLKELARRGHNLTVISYFPQKQPLENYHDIDLGKGKSLFELNHPVSVSYAQALLSFAILQPIVGSYTCRQILDDEEVQDIILTQRKFDLVVAEQFNTDCPLAIAHLLKAPVVGITSYMLLPWHYPRYGVPYNPSYILYDVYHGGTKPTFLQRIVRSFSYQFINFLQKHICKHEDSVISHYYDNVPSVEELGRQVKFLLLYQNLVLAGSQILPPNVVEVGGYHIAQPKQLPADLQNFIDESKNGVIYISFGTILQGSSIKKEYFRAILDVVSELPQRVVWKWDKKLPQNITNIYSSKWLPQNDILSHPNVVAFFSHCGMLGTTEAIHHGVPVLGMPVIGDQFTNAAAIEEQGLGVQISYNSISKELLLEKFKVILDPRFRTQVKTISQMWRDRPATAMNTAIHWTEFAARYNNYTFRTPAADVPLYQYLGLDVAVVLLLLSITLIWILKSVLMYSIKSINLRKKSKKLKSD
ncbi:UDP-glycosyltransferase UGT5-like [Leptidea sinapis]|uniref:UDP-glycosyltransferase UGT5-like n=1 Tax=Leptidea sinapis TaxID=189913 RepID=UPI0021463C1B|nr:UDP-glycosyltransferase UGT5-like [Leptidea sinapis]